jgi:prepilin-type processing-associated H-X9-DG protein
MMPEMNVFWKNYLVKNTRSTRTSKRAANDVLFCPTEEWHRSYETGITSDSAPQLLGYFYLPGRKAGSMDSASAQHKTAQWFYRTKLGQGTNQWAPVLIDKNQATGPITTNMLDSRLNWFLVDNGKRVRTGTHFGAKGVPEGGNFLFEDGHVEWFSGRSKQISVGASIGTWQCYFKIPITQ